MRRLLRCLSDRCVIRRLRGGPVGKTSRAFPLGVDGHRRGGVAGVLELNGTFILYIRGVI